MEISDILQAFAVNDGEYKREAVDAALAQREAITPHLLAILKNTLNNSEEIDDSAMGHMYALMLLAYFRETEAHDLIVDLASLPDEQPFELIGETITENLGNMLYQTCGGSIKRIKELAANSQANQFCRNQALNALEYCMLEGIVSEEELLAFVHDLFQAEMDSEYLVNIANFTCDLYPEPFMKEIDAAFESGRIESSFTLQYGDIKRSLVKGKERCRNDFKEDFEYRAITNVHKTMSWWACFDSKPALITPLRRTPMTILHSAKGDRKQKKLKKNKAKASRRKNRRKKK